jgi:PII-like signaling protein
MLEGERWLRLRIYIGEKDHYKGKPLYMYLLHLFRSMGLKGATVYQGIAGYGSHSMIHHIDVLRLSEDLPIVIEVVDTRDSILKILPEVKNIVREGLITLEEVNVIFYGHRQEGEKVET